GSWATVVFTTTGVAPTIAAANAGTLYIIEGTSVTTALPSTSVVVGSQFGGHAILNSQTLTCSGVFYGPQGNSTNTVVIPAGSDFYAVFDGTNYELTVIPLGVIATNSGVATSIAVETSRAEAAESANASAIGAETSRAEGVETILAAAIGVNVTTS